MIFISLFVHTDDKGQEIMLAFIEEIQSKESQVAHHTTWTFISIWITYNMLPAVILILLLTLNKLLLTANDVVV